MADQINMQPQGQGDSGMGTGVIVGIVIVILVILLLFFGRGFFRPGSVNNSGSTGINDNSQEVPNVNVPQQNSVGGPTTQPQ